MRHLSRSTAASHAAQRQSHRAVTVQAVKTPVNGAVGKGSSNGNEAFDKVSVDELDDFDPATSNRPLTPLLDTVNFPVHIKNFNRRQLKQLCKELREDIIFNVSSTGGHLGASLGVTDLTVALHYVFNAPEDKFIFDVGHQVTATQGSLPRNLHEVCAPMQIPVHAGQSCQNSLC